VEGEAQSCIDPFGGSGTTALTGQFLGVSSTTIEVNPFLADVIRAKLARYNADALAHDLGRIGRAKKGRKGEPSKVFSHVPSTFLEPGLNGRWLFNREVARELAVLLESINELPDPKHRRVFRVLFGGILTEVSNVLVSGKGRRYRRNWAANKPAAGAVWRKFTERATTAIADIHRFSNRPEVRADVIHGDARTHRVRRLHDIAIFSPPYPNSFDYTDVYNLELWMLGYLDNGDTNRTLRHATLSSHVQLLREFAPSPVGSIALSTAVESLQEAKASLWSPWIPAMVGAYFADLARVIGRLSKALKPGGLCCVVIGDSRYSGIEIASAQILAELAISSEWEVRSMTPVRAMRTSAQQGGRSELSESLLVLARR
jgi:hypothetical protein